MKILILTPDIYTRGGIARYTATLASAFVKLVGAANVHVQPLLDLGGSREIPAKCRVFHPVARRLTAGSKLWFAGKALGLGIRRYDLIVSSHVGLAPVAAMMHLLFETPYWVVCHGIEAWERLGFVEREALWHADSVIPVSRFTADRVAETNGVPIEKITVVYNAIPDDFASSLTSPDGTAQPVAAWGHAKCLLSVGVLAKTSAHKGIDTVIRALPQVLESVPGARYVVVGRGDGRENLEELAVAMGVAEHVEFTGEISDAELAARYRACDVFVLPSRTARRNGCWQGEGFGRVYAEAALAGKPVVGSRDGGAAEAVLDGKTGLLVDPASVADVTAALLRLLQEDALAAAMGSAGQGWARENFTTRALQRRLGEALGDLQETRLALGALRLDVD